MAENRLTATPAAPEEQVAIEKFMAVIARLEGKTVKDLFAPGSILRITKQEGCYHVAVDVPIDHSVP